MKKPDCEEIVTSYNSDSDKFKAENKWHDRIDFPFAGTECEMYVVSGWHLARIIGMDDQGLCVASVHFDEHRGYRSSPDIRDFRPLKTDAELDRDAAIERMAKATLTPGSPSTISICKLLYDAGYRKTMSREKANERLAYHVNEILLRPIERSQILDVLYYGKE